jgi:hypothetical protein
MNDALLISNHCHNDHSTCLQIGAAHARAETGNGQIRYRSLPRDYTF